MIFDERNREAKLFIEAERIKSKTPEQTLDTFFDMNRSVMKICVESIMAQNPGISERRLLKEVKRAYASRQ